MQRSVPSFAEQLSRSASERLGARYGDLQAALTAEYGKSWRCRCEKDPTLSCHARLEACLRKNGRLLRTSRRRVAH